MAAILDIKNAKLVKVEFFPSGFPALMLEKIVSFECFVTSTNDIVITVETRDFQDAMSAVPGFGGRLEILVRSGDESEPQRHVLGECRLRARIPVQPNKGMLIAKLIFSP